MYGVSDAVVQACAWKQEFRLSLIKGSYSSAHLVFTKHSCLVELLVCLVGLPLINYSN